MQVPKFTLDDVKYADGPATYRRARELYDQGRVGRLEVMDGDRGYRAVVHGTRPYEAWISTRRVDEGDCTCYLDQNDVLCKHMLALAIAVLAATGNDKEPEPTSDLAEAKKLVAAGLKQLRPYRGPSRVWFAYQRTLATGAGMVTEAVSGLPATLENATYLWSLVLRISKKLATSGIDDSDGTVGDCVSDIVVRLGKYAEEAPSLKEPLRSFCDDDTGFGFEDELRSLLK